MRKMKYVNEKMISEEINKLVPVFGKANAARINRAFLLGDEKTRIRISELIDVMKAAVFNDKGIGDGVLMNPPEQDVAGKGNIELGKVLYGKKELYPFRIDQNSLLTHIGIFGSSGYGKTNISYDIIEQLTEQDIPVIVFDFSKRNYKDLLSTKLKDKIDIFTVGRNAAPFKFNPLVPPEGVTLSQWMKEFASIFDHAYWLLGGGRHIILKALDGVYENREKPKMTDLKKWVTEYGAMQLPARERNWLATAARPLESLCFKELGDVFDCSTGVKPSEFFKPGRITIIELDAIDTNDKTFLIEIILQWIRDWLLVKNERETLKGVIILEEAHHVLNREKASKLGTETVVDLIFREIRELGMGIVYLDQHPSLVSYPALGNTSTHIYMNLALDTKHSSDILDSSNMLGLNYAEEGDYLRRLSIGTGFVMNRASEFTKPFLVKFDKADLIKGSVSDKDIRELMKTKLEKYFDVEPEAERKIISEDDNIAIDQIDEHGWEIMDLLGNSRATFTSQIYNELNVSGSAFNKKVKKLMDHGLVAVSRAKTQKNRFHYYFLTDKGQSVFMQHFGKINPERERDIRELVDLFIGLGWKHNPKSNTFTFKEKGRNVTVVLETGADPERIYRNVAENMHFICGSERVKNMVAQQAAKYVYRNGGNPVYFIGLVENFEKRGFERIEFET
jgi:DNA-binding MarR family transcriptional regulator